ncbi:hypothetical protein PHMEG_00019952 [Phytophthora megakarya]|uniref:Ubiquitin-like protease family profile domain-containing protein n=1 Tax=Phytophthora megakarya TaxID=4795 RepID=A0A225VQL9_9STRA|nr:hypothetical protein PHMEG_00019952 [Phytophthora megakarya]
MIDFSSEPGNIGHIFVDKVHQTTIATCITYTKHMREPFDRFPEVLMIDAMHGTNMSKYKGFSIMAHDVFGKGQFVQNERRTTLLAVLIEFKRNNRCWTKIKCVIIDKDFTEMSVLKVAFPDAVVLLCQFHVIKYLREEIAKSDYGFTVWQKQQLQRIVNSLVYAKTQREFEKGRAYMRHVMTVGRGGNVHTWRSVRKKFTGMSVLKVMNIVDWTAKQQISDDVMMDFLSKKFGWDHSVVVIDPANLGVEVSGSVTAPHERIRNALVRLSNEKVLVPVNCSGNYWCGIMMDLTMREVYAYDPSATSYISGVRTVAQVMMQLLPDTVTTALLSRIYDPGLGTQSDNYTCGIYLLLTFEIFSAELSRWGSWTNGCSSVCSTDTSYM